MPVAAAKGDKGIGGNEVDTAPSAKKAETQHQDAIFDKILEVYDIQVPQSLVDDEVTRMLLELNYRMKYESMASGNFPGFTQEELADQVEQIKVDAFKQVKTRLVLKEIIKAENFEVSREELEEEAKAISLRQNVPIEMVRDFLGDDLETLKNDLLVRKAIEFVTVNTVIQ